MTHFFSFRQVIMTFLAFLISINTILGAGLSPAENVVLAAHLIEVNQEWTKQHDIPVSEMMQYTHFRNDTERIQTHLKLVERILRQRNTMHLNKEQQHNRNQLLDVLNTYSKAAIFPTNLYHAHRQPYFVDHKNVHCAVGYLLQQSGEMALVHRIKTADNYAYIHELVKYTELQKWADKQGFTVEELAWIQPGYPPSGQAFETVGNGGGVAGQVYAMLSSPDSATLYMAGHFTAVDGEPANNIIAWNGTDWETLGNGIDGTIHTMEHYQGQLVVGGDFSLNGQPCNIAMWSSNNTWTPLQTGDMQGTVYALKYQNGRLYAGGDFQMVNGQNLPYLAFLPTLNANWTNAANSWSSTNAIPNAFTVNAPVRCFEIVANQLLVGGDFTATAALTTDSSINHLTPNYLAYWDGDNWTSSLQGQHEAVHTVKFRNGTLYIGGKVSAQNPISFYTAGVWNYISHLSFAGQGDSLVHNFVEHNGNMYAIGDFKFYPFVGVYGGGIIKISDQFFAPEGVINIDSSITAAFSYDGKMYMAGTFDQIGNTSYKGLMASTLISTNTSSIKNEPSIIQIRHGAGQVFVQYENLKQRTTLQLFNVNGQLLENVNLPSGNQMISLETLTLSKGMYFYQVQVANKKESGKIALF